MIELKDKCNFSIFLESNFVDAHEHNQLQFFLFLGNRCLVQVGWTVGKWKERNNVFSSIPNYIYMSHDIQLFPVGYPGKLFCLQFGSFYSCNYLQYILHAGYHFLRNIQFINTMLFQVCKFQVGSYSYNMEKMIFHVSQLGYAHTSR